MVNEENNSDMDIDITNDEEMSGTEESELEEIESNAGDKIKDLRAKLKIAQEKARQLQDEVQRNRADFLNAKRRLEEDRARDKIRFKKRHIEDILPLCDSFSIAFRDKESWEKTDKAWRSGIEGIYSQLQQILKEAGVKMIDPQGEAFDPNRHEAVGTAEVDDESLEDVIVTVVQPGYEISIDNKTELIRPARVTIGSLKN